MVGFPVRNAGFIPGLAKSPGAQNLLATVINTPILQVRRLRSKELRNSCNIQDLAKNGDGTEA